MRFTKMQGLGNDYLYFFEEVPENVRELCLYLCDRHFGVGADGLIFILPSMRADFSMRIFNADGSEAEMCGNGIRCVGKYLYDKGYTDREYLQIETASGVRALHLHVARGVVRAVTVDMGKAEVSARRALTAAKETAVPVKVGNPHAVIFVDDAESAPVGTEGPKIERDPAFPGGANVEFVSKTGKNELRMRVWERGSGVTMACGTGACAAAAAAVFEGICSFDTPIAVKLDGGTLEIVVDGDMRITMTGGAETIFEGEVNLC